MPIHVISDEEWDSMLAAAERAGAEFALERIRKYGPVAGRMPNPQTRDRVTGDVLKPPADGVSANRR